MRKFGLPETSSEFQALTMGDLREAWWADLYEQRQRLQARVQVGDRAPGTREHLDELNRILGVPDAPGTAFEQRMKQAAEEGDLERLQEGLPAWIK